MMKELCNDLYQSMLQDFEHCRKKQLDALQELECCFQICNSYWANVKSCIASYVFGTTTEEIYFFKSVKPLFTSEIVYYGLVSFAELTKARETDPCALEKFWKNESQRLEKFIRANHGFYTYYKTGQTAQDALFFTREKNGLDYFIKSKAYDEANNAASSHDHLVASLLALEKYQEYLKKNKSGYVNKN